MYRCFQITCAFILIFILNGCAVYQPQTTDIPLINKKDELKMDLGISLMPSVNGTVSYGLTDNIAIQGSCNLLPAAAHYSKPLMQYLLTGAVGLYKFNPTNNWTKELYLGFGNGFASDYDYDHYHSGSLLGNYQIYYLQGDIGRRGIKLKFFEYAFGLRVGLINSHFYVENVYTFVSHTQGPIYNELGAFIEAAFSFKIGGEKLMFNIKPGFCYMKKLISSNDIFSDQVKYINGFGYEYPYQPFTLGISLNYKL